MATTVISYINLATSIANVSGSFEADAPLSNILTPRLGQKAIRLSGDTYFEVYFGSGSPTRLADISLIALLGHNILQIDGILNIDIRCAMEDGSQIISVGFDPASLGVNPSDGTFQSHLIWYVPNTDATILQKKCEFVSVAITFADVICGTKNPYTGEIESAPLEIGGIWIGPVFKPEHGISISGFSSGIADNSQVVRSIGGQVWAEPEIRQRVMKVNFAGLTEDEVFALAPRQCLQQLSAHCGVSRPLIVIPTTSDDELMYTQGVYGYLSAPATWELQEKTKDASTGQMVRLYTGALEVLEAR